MNQQAICHTVEGCNCIYIDAFKAFKTKTEDAKNAFILTHYHSDHYNGLPRGEAYIGPALIHCTPITARLLIEVHKIQSKFIEPHDYGITWIYAGSEITFYDANHCPGAAIVLVKNPLGSWHLHTGDMRYNYEKFSTYTKLSQVIQERKLDTLYLDTTYSKPKHTFIPQNEAIEEISSQVKILLEPNERIVQDKKQSFFNARTSKDCPTRTLVLLSCYSIGKEKVLWHSSEQSKQLIYVNQAKYKMLQCIQEKKNARSEESIYNIVDKCTQDPSRSDLHVIQMGTAGSLFPFFQPNFTECALYAHRLNKGYGKVVAFIPTGWADSSKYNKDNAIARKTLDLRDLLDGKKINGNKTLMDVEVRLVAYSEHSSYDELRACVEYMKPKKIIPTVFSGEKDYEAIEKRFRDLVDGQRVKKAFIDSIVGGSKKKLKMDSSVDDKRVQDTKQTDLTMQQVEITPSPQIFVNDSQVALLVSMGFDAQKAAISLVQTNNNVDAALEQLLNNTI